MFLGFTSKITGKLLLTAIGIFGAGLANADTTVYCYRLNMEKPQLAEDSKDLVDQETWCYQDLQDPAGATYIYNTDDKEVKAELALIVEKDNTITHGSLLNGEITIHKVKAADFNPYSVPLKRPDTLSAVPTRLLDPKIQSAQKVLDYLRSRAGKVHEMTLTPGIFSAEVATINLPWRGYWWPQKNQTIGGPLRKYDEYVSRQTGSNPGAAAWERSRHKWGGSSWEGHCNGWAASSVLRRQPTSPRTVGGVNFSVTDLKGLLAEKDYCAKVAFFGKRYRGPADNKADINPATFHKTIRYYIGNLGKPVAMDYNSGVVVDNHVVSGYSTNVLQTSATTFAITTSLRVHRYDKTRIEEPGVAPTYTRTYRYTLTQDGSGNITGGTWHTANPDFLWVPLSPTTCSKNNPHVTENFIQQIIY